jgi:hypothetical protein
MTGRRVPAVARRQLSLPADGCAGCVDETHLPPGPLPMKTRPGWFGAATIWFEMDRCGWARNSQLSLCPSTERESETDGLVGCGGLGELAGQRRRGRHCGAGRLVSMWLYSRVRPTHRRGSPWLRVSRVNPPNLCSPGDEPKPLTSVHTLRRVQSGERRYTSIHSVGYSIYNLEPTRSGSLHRSRSGSLLRPLFSRHNCCTPDVNTLDPRHVHS